MKRGMEKREGGMGARGWGKEGEKESGGKRHNVLFSIDRIVIGLTRGCGLLVNIRKVFY